MICINLVSTRWLRILKSRKLTCNAVDDERWSRSVMPKNSFSSITLQRRKTTITLFSLSSEVGEAIATTVEPSYTAVVTPDLSDETKRRASE